MAMLLRAQRQLSLLREDTSTFACTHADSRSARGVFAPLDTPIATIKSASSIAFLLPSVETLSLNRFRTEHEVIDRQVARAYQHFSSIGTRCADLRENKNEFRTTP